MFCPNCGRNVGDAAFCPACGTAIQSASSAGKPVAKVEAAEKFAALPWVQKLTDLQFLPAIIAYALIPLVWLLNSVANHTFLSTIGSFQFWLQAIACGVLIFALTRKPIDKILPIGYCVMALNALVYVLRYIASRFTFGFRFDFGSVFGFFVDALIIFAFLIAAVIFASMVPMLPALSDLYGTAQKLWFLPAACVGGLNLIGLIFSLISWLAGSRHSFGVLLLYLFNNLLPIVGIVVVCLQMHRLFVVKAAAPAQSAEAPVFPTTEPVAPTQADASPDEAPAQSAEEPAVPTASPAAPAAEPAEPDAQSAAVPSDKTVETLVQYKKLLDEGVITQEEFDEKKRQFLGM